MQFAGAIRGWRGGGRSAAGCDNFSKVNILLRSAAMKYAAHAYVGSVTRSAVRGGVTRISRR